MRVLKYPYCLVSDLHCHSWSAFSKVNPDGVNSRLQIILDEAKRAADTLLAAGGDTIIEAGDLFHVRGSVQPSVFNPTFAAFREIASKLDVHALPGNHDLEGKDASSIGNAMQGLGSIKGFNVCITPTLVGDVWVFPWFQNLNDLRTALRNHADKTKDAVIHAPVNGVIKGIPDHGLEASELAAMGYRRVFAGHYHNHVVFEDGKVVSIGATTHQTWSDPGSKAGFLLVYEDRIEHVPSEAPKFVDLSPEALDAAEANGTDIEEIVRGSYVRLKLNDVTDKEVTAWRKDIEDAGAAGCIILSTKKTAVSRSGAVQQATASLASSVEAYVIHDLKPLLTLEVSKEAQDVLSEAMQ